MCAKKRIFSVKTKNFISIFRVIFCQINFVEIPSMDASKAIKIDPKTLSVGIIGYTGKRRLFLEGKLNFKLNPIWFQGESGKALTTECLKNDLFKSTVLIGRRNIKYDEEFYNKGVSLNKNQMSLIHNFNSYFYDFYLDSKSNRFRQD